MPHRTVLPFVRQLQFIALLQFVSISCGGGIDRAGGDAAEAGKSSTDLPTHSGSIKPLENMYETSLVAY